MMRFRAAFLIGAERQFWPSPESGVEGSTETVERKTQSGILRFLIEFPVTQHLIAMG
jgi:hypothetical protein